MILDSAEPTKAIRAANRVLMAASLLFGAAVILVATRAMPMKLHHPMPSALLDGRDAGRSWEAGPCPRHIYEKVKMYARLGNDDGNNQTDLASRCNAFGGLFAQETTFSAPPFPPITSRVVLAGICVNRIVARWDKLDDPVDGPRWGISPVGDTWGNDKEGHKVVLTHTAQGTKEGKAHMIPLTSILWFNPAGEITMSWDFFDSAPYPVLAP